MMQTTYDFRPQSFERRIKLADEFLRAANLLTSSAPWHAAFWYHQAAERYLKACLVRRGHAFTNSVAHLRRLLEMCVALEPQFERIGAVLMTWPPCNAPLTFDVARAMVPGQLRRGACDVFDEQGSLADV